MTNKKTVNVTLGDLTVAVGRLSIGVIREIDLEMNDDPTAGLSKREQEEFFFDQALKVIAHGLSTVDPKYTLEEVKKIEVEGISQIYEAQRAILSHAGMVPTKKEAVPGEAASTAS